MTVFRSKYKTDPEDDIDLSLLYQSSSDDDILMVKDLARWSKHYPLRVKLSVENPSEEWMGHKGRFTDSFLRKGLPLPKGDELVIIAVQEDIKKQLEDRI